VYVQDFLPPKDEVIAKALALPKVKPGASSEVVMRAVGDTVAALAKEKIEREIYIDLADACAMYEVTNGEYADIDDGDEGDRERDNYSSGMDDGVEAALEKYDEHLSADWLGRSTIDTQLWNKGATEALAKSAAKEVWKQLTYDKTPAQVLASAGIVAEDVEQAASNQTTDTGDNGMADNDLEGVVLKIKEHVGKDFDQLTVYEDLEMVCEEDDEILLDAAASRLGMSDADVQTVQIAALELDDAPTEICEMIASAKAPSKTAKKKAAKAKEKAEAEEGAVDASVLSALKECGVGDTAMAEALGVSRSTYVNYCKGKTPFAPDAEQYQLVRNELVERANSLVAALSALDGVPREGVA
tara:strand:+ start:885 stop:1955 length:1071 start_codon:yes stop_codon:yes gene_type:complete